MCATVRTRSTRLFIIKVGDGKNRIFCGYLRQIHTDSFSSEEIDMLENNTRYSETGVAATAVTPRNGLLYLGVGAAVGATLALLFAPKPGSELRGDIADVTRRGYDATKEKAIDLKDQSADALKAVKEKAATVYDFAVDKMASGTESVNNAVSATAGAVKEGLENLGDDSASSSSRGSSRRPSSVM